MSDNEQKINLMKVTIIIISTCLSHDVYQQ
jgi:hypothetical protein